MQKKTHTHMQVKNKKKYIKIYLRVIIFFLLIIFFWTFTPA